MTDHPATPSVGESRPIQYLHQCPGCWGYGLFATPMSKTKGEGWIECNGCGERMTRIDLRDSEATP